MFWSAVGIALVCVVVATKRWLLVTALLGIAALRLGLGFLWLRDAYLSLAAVACAVLAWMAVAADTSDYPDR